MISLDVSNKQFRDEYSTIGNIIFYLLHNTITFFAKSKLCGLKHDLLIGLVYILDMLIS